MSIEEIIGALERLKVETGSLACLGCGSECGCSVLGCNIINEAIAMLKSHPDAQPNEPLTLENTLEMHGTPVYLYFPDGGEWVLIRVLSKERKKVELVHRNGITAPIRFVFEGGGKLYRRPQKED